MDEKKTRVASALFSIVLEIKEKDFLKLNANMDQDVSACEKILGKVPEPPHVESKNDSVKLSESVAERLQNGVVDGDRMDNYDTYWINKLLCIDESHSVRNNLDIQEAEEKLKSLQEYAESGLNLVSTLHEALDKDRVRDCFKESPGEMLRCSSIVENFIVQVDQLMYDAVRKHISPDTLSSNKKLSYADRFKLEFRF